jgi:uncharacterized surface protein with fasciclin (FAS1) repeats
MKTARTVNGKELTIAAAGGGVTIDGARVVKTDIMASTGVIHFVDEVVMPR